MLIDGQPVHAYEVVLFHHPRPTFAFDVRPIDEMERVWLETWKNSDLLSINKARSQMRAQLVNERTTRKFVEADYDNDAGRELDFEIAPTDIPTKETLLRFNGIPWRSNYGAAVLIADLVRGFSYVVHFQEVSGEAR